MDKVSNELKKEGFGILTQINVTEKFKEKLDIDFKKYIILGACNPPSAHKAILIEENIGLMLPCNVVIYERRIPYIVFGTFRNGFRYMDNIQLLLIFKMS